MTDPWLEVRALKKRADGSFVDEAVEYAEYFEVAVFDYGESGMERDLIELKSAGSLEDAQKHAKGFVDWHAKRGRDLGIDSENVPEEIIDFLNDNIAAQPAP